MVTKTNQRSNEPHSWTSLVTRRRYRSDSVLHKRIFFFRTCSIESAACWKSHPSFAISVYPISPLDIIAEKLYEWQKHQIKSFKNQQCEPHFLMKAFLFKKTAYIFEYRVRNVKFTLSENYFQSNINYTQNALKTSCAEKQRTKFEFSETLNMKLSPCSIKHRAIKTEVGVEVWLHAFLTMTSDGRGELSTILDGFCLRRQAEGSVVKESYILSPTDKSLKSILSSNHYMFSRGIPQSLEVQCGKAF